MSRIEITTYTSNEEKTWLDDCFKTKWNSLFKFKNKSGEYLNIDITYLGWYNLFISKKVWNKDQIFKFFFKNKEDTRAAITKVMDLEGFKENPKVKLNSNLLDFEENFLSNFWDNDNFENTSNKKEDNVHKDLIKKVKKNIIEYIKNVPLVYLTPELLEATFSRKTEDKKYHHWTLLDLFNIFFLHLDRNQLELTPESKEVVEKYFIIFFKEEKEIYKKEWDSFLDQEFFRRKLIHSNNYLTYKAKKDLISLYPNFIYSLDGTDDNSDEYISLVNQALNNLSDQYNYDKSEVRDLNYLKNLISKKVNLSESEKEDLYRKIDKLNK